MADAFSPHPVETISRPFSAALGPQVSKPTFGGTGVSDCAVRRNHLSVLASPSEPPEIALGPNPAFYRAGQNQLIASLFVGEAQAGGSAPDDLFKVTRVVNGADIADTVEQSGCKMPWPT